MKPYSDENCKCHEVESEIRERYPECNWNVDDACRAWNEAAPSLENNSIVFEAHSDECYGCTCPTCGRMVCGWCV